jgi:hypothetical protein
MAEKNESRQPTHRAYSVIHREGQDDFWLNLGLVFDHRSSGPPRCLAARSLAARSAAWRPAREQEPGA